MWAGSDLRDDDPFVVKKISVRDQSLYSSEPGTFAVSSYEGSAEKQKT